MTDHPIEIAPDSSQILRLQSNPSASQVLCRLPAGQVSISARHKTITEFWYVLSGEGHLAIGEQVISLQRGAYAQIKPHEIFQFAAKQDLEILITTLPPWPGDDEAETFDRGPLNDLY